MKEQTLTYINQFKVDKDGKPYTTKNGKPFVRVSVKVEEYGNEYVSGLWFGADCPWKVGEKIQMEIKKEIYNGKESLKFELPKKENPNQKYFEEIAGRLLKLELMIIKIGQHLMPPEKDDYPPLTEENTPTF